jgi:hypothetical protein
LVLTEEERKANLLKQKRAYDNKPEVKARKKDRQKEYESRPEVKAKRLEYVKKYYSRPENKAKRAEYRKEYDSRPEVKAKRADLTRPEVKAKRAYIKEYMKKYTQTPEYKAKRKEYSQKPEVKARALAHSQKPESRSTALKRMINNRLQVLQHYSKEYSKTDIPCCRCCGLNSHIDFLDIDHIRGRKEMDSEPEFIEMGYSSKMSSHVLLVWIIKNNFPKGFQVLCKNCNMTKGMPRNNNECPMKGKPHF